MQLIKMLKRSIYEGKIVTPDDVFEVPTALAKDLVKRGFAVNAEIEVEGEFTEVEETNAELQAAIAEFMTLTLPELKEAAAENAIATKGLDVKLDYATALAKIELAPKAE